MPAVPKPLITNYKQLRLSLGLNQTEFWTRLGVTQSGGSRYEHGDRNVPKSAAVLARLIYIDGLDVDAREFE